ncbi:MAG: hypothetical protein ACLQM8_18310 [Limisphaerales bacterium]
MSANASNQPEATPGSPGRPRGQAAGQEPRLEPDKADLNGSEALDRALQETPEVRPEKVAQAKALIEDAAYPSADVVAKIASLMAESGINA